MILMLAGFSGFSYHYAPVSNQLRALESKPAKSTFEEKNYESC